MSLTTLGPRTALVVVDLQEGAPRSRPRLGETGTTGEVLDLLGRTRG